MKEKDRFLTKRISLLALFTALAMILSYIESMIPVIIGVPGIKIGLPNLIVVMVLYQMRYKAGFVVDVVRILATGFLFGNMFSICFSLAGGMLSYLIMCICYRFRFHIVTCSIAGGITHNLGQFLAAFLLVQNKMLWYYYPILMMAGFIAGLCNGLLAMVICRRTTKVLQSELE